MNTPKSIAFKNRPRAARNALSKRAAPPGATLIAVVGVSPAILTETVWALANPNDGSSAVIPIEVIAITTLRGQEAIDKHLRTRLAKFGGRTAWQSLREDLLGPDAAHDERLTLRVNIIERADPATGGTEKLPDIWDRDQNLVAAEFILKQVRDHTNANDRRLIASLAGGRKTMGALLHAAFSHLARPQDRLTHILVSEPYDTLYDAQRNPLFFYPTQPEQPLTGRDGKTYQAREAKLELADVPFAPMRLRFPDIADIPTRFRDLVERYVEAWKRDATKPAVIELLEEPPRFVVDGVAVELESERQFTVLRFLLEANQKTWLKKSQFEAVALFKAFHGYQPSPSEENSIRPSLRARAQRLFQQKQGTPGPPWIASATTDDIKRPLSRVRVALEKAGSSWKPAKRDLELPSFRLVGES